MKWVKVLIGAATVLGLWGAAGYAEDKTDRGLPSPDRNWQIGFAPSYSKGDFGTDSTSTFFYAPTLIRRIFRDGDVTLVIPFITATTDGRTTIVGGRPVPVDGQSNSGPGGGGNVGGAPGGCPGGNRGNNSGPGASQRSCLTGRAPGQNVTTTGFGDIILRGRYYAVEEKEYMPLVALTARMKFPTADETVGLGTGAFDHGYGVELSKLIGERWIAFLDGGYNFIGDPDGLELRNQHWYDVGAGYYLTEDLLTSVYFEEYRSLVPGFQNFRDIFFSVNYRASSAWRFNGGVALGLSNGAPDHMLSIGASYRF